MYLNSINNSNRGTCETCVKSDVCKYKEEKAHFTIPVVPNFLDVEIKCKYYYNNTDFASITARTTLTANDSNISIC